MNTPAIQGDPPTSLRIARNPTVAFIGGGQMASALIRGLLRSGWTARTIQVVEPDPEQRHRLESVLGVRTMSAGDPSLAQAAIVVWAVKPQVLCAAVVGIVDHLRTPLHISIVAGIATTELSRWLKSSRIVRAMPNTPALVGSGVTGMLAMDGVGQQDRDSAQGLLAATGFTFWVDTDDRIDAITAVSGSGPGYVFQFLESFQAGAELLGFSESQARELVLRTAAGAIEQASADSTPFSLLRERVTSKRGTTEAGLEVLSRHNVSTAVCLAVASAYARARELSGEFGQVADGGAGA